MGFSGLESNFFLYGIAVFILAAIVFWFIPNKKLKHKNIIVIAVIALGLIAGTATILINNANRITTAEQLEQDARQSRSVGADWDMAQAVTDEIAVMLFYNEDLSDHNFWIYENDGGSHTSYVFKNGGSSSMEIGRNIKAYYHHTSLVLISMNADHVAKIECQDGESYTIDPNKPFAVIVPSGSELFDENGDVVGFLEPILLQ